MEQHGACISQRVHLARHHLKGLYVVALGKVRSFLMSSFREITWFGMVSQILDPDVKFKREVWEVWKDATTLCFFLGGSLKGFKKNIFQIALLL